MLFKKQLLCLSELAEKKYNKTDVSCFVELSPCLDSYSIKLVVLEKSCPVTPENWRPSSRGLVAGEGKHVVEEFRAGRLLSNEQGKR